MQKTVLVIFGGNSNENEVSVVTGTMAANVLKGAGYAVVPLYFAQDGRAYTGEKLMDITSFKGDGFKSQAHAIIALGGIYALNKRGKFKKFGENGALSGLCEIASIPFASACVFESSAFMDKYITKLVLSALGVKTAEYCYVKSGDTPRNMLQFPVIVKPVNLGSSIGVEKAENKTQLKEALECAFIYDSAAIVEKYLDNRREINCAAYMGVDGIDVSECEEAFTAGDILSFEDKYQGGGKSVLPADIPPNMSQLIKNTTHEVYEKLNMRGIVRFDYIISGGEVYLSEVNTVPGSLSYYLLSRGFKDFAGVLTDVIARAEIDFEIKKNKKLIKTGILENVNANACKLGAK